MQDETKPVEAKPAPIQKDLSKDVGLMVAAFNLSKTATSYTEGNEKFPGNILQGSAGAPNATLSRFIKIAEKQFVKNMQKEIIEIARDLIETELDKIRGLLG